MSMPAKQFWKVPLLALFPSLYFTARSSRGGCVALELQVPNAVMKYNYCLDKAVWFRLSYLDGRSLADK